MGHLPSHLCQPAAHGQIVIGVGHQQRGRKRILLHQPFYRTANAGDGGVMVGHHCFGVAMWGLTDPLDETCFSFQIARAARFSQKKRDFAVTQAHQQASSVPAHGAVVEVAKRER